MVESTKLGRGVGCCWQGWRGGCLRGIDPRAFISNRCVSLKVSRNCLLLQMTHIAVSLTCVDAPSVAGGEPFAGCFRLIDAGLEENPYLAALREGEVAGSIPLQRHADTLRKLLLRLHYYIAVTLNGCLIVGLRRALLSLLSCSRQR